MANWLEAITTSHKKLLVSDHVRRTCLWTSDIGATPSPRALRTGPGARGASGRLESPDPGSS